MPDIKMTASDVRHRLNTPAPLQLHLLLSSSPLTVEGPMPQFSNEPPTGGDRQGIALIRTPANRPFVAIVTSEDLVGCATHYYRNRTTPCEGDDCAICAEGLPWRWHGYLSCVDQHTNDHVMFEFTANASDAFRTYRNQYRTMRGCHFKATRQGNRYNGRVHIICKPADLAGKRLPPGANLPAMCCHIWNIPMDSAKVKGENHRHPALRVVSDVLQGGNAKQPV